MCTRRSRLHRATCCSHSLEMPRGESYLRRTSRVLRGRQQSICFVLRGATLSASFLRTNRPRIACDERWRLCSGGTEEKQGEQQRSIHTAAHTAAPALVQHSLRTSPYRHLHRNID